MATTISNIPARRSKTARLRLVTDARRSLADVRTLIGDDASPKRVLRLLWAQALIDRALHMETRGALGDPHATPQKMEERARAATSAATGAVLAVLRNTLREQGLTADITPDDAGAYYVTVPEQDAPGVVWFVDYTPGRSRPWRADRRGDDGQDEWHEHVSTTGVLALLVSRCRREPVDPLDRTLQASSVETLLRTYAALTHRMHEAEDDADARAQRDVVAAEIARRAQWDAAGDAS